MHRLFVPCVVGLAFVGNSGACARSEDLDDSAFGPAGSQTVTAGTGPPATVGAGGMTGSTSSASVGTGGSPSTTTAAGTTTAGATTTSATTSTTTAGGGGSGGSPAGTGGAGRGSAGGAGGASGSSGATGGAGRGGSGGAGTGGSGGGSCTTTVTNYMQGRCNSVLAYNGLVYRCISQAAGVNGEPTGCGMSGVYCSTITPTDAAWGATAWQVLACP